MIEFISLDNIDYRKKYSVLKECISDTVEYIHLSRKDSGEYWGTLAKICGEIINPWKSDNLEDCSCSPDIVFVHGNVGQVSECWCWGEWVCTNCQH